MSKPVAFIDASYIVSLIHNSMNIGVEGALARLSEKYELHITRVVLLELEEGQFGRNDFVRDWFDNKKNYHIDDSPVSVRYRADLASEGKIDKNLGDFSLVEAAAKYPSAVILSDDKFFSKISSGLETPNRWVVDRKTAAFAKIAPIFDNVFPKEVASNYLSHAQTLLSDAKNGVIDAPTLFLPSTSFPHVFTTSITSMVPLLAR